MQDGVGASGGADLTRVMRGKAVVKDDHGIPPQRLKPVLAHEAERVAQIHNIVLAV